MKHDKNEPHDLWDHCADDQDEAAWHEEMHAHIDRAFGVMRLIAVGVAVYVIMAAAVALLS